MDTGGDNGNVAHGNEENDDDDMPDLQQMVTSSDLNNSKDNWRIIYVQKKKKNCKRCRCEEKPAFKFEELSLAPFIVAQEDFPYQMYLAKKNLLSHPKWDVNKTLDFKAMKRCCPLTNRSWQRSHIEYHFLKTPK